MGVVDVLYIHPAKQPVGFRYDQAPGYLPYLLMPVGVVGLANALRQEGYTVRGVNYAIEAFLDPRFDLTAWLGKLRDARLVMIDLHWYEHSYGALDVARVSKEALPEARVVLGGFTASHYAREILEHFPQVDYIIRGDAEEPLLSLARHLCRGSGGISELAAMPNLSYRDGDSVAENELSYCATAERLDQLDFVDTSFLDHCRRYHEMQYTGVARIEGNVAQILATAGHWLCMGRGCRFDCSFCGGSKTSHKLLAGREGITLRSIERVVHDIERLHQMGLDQVSLALDPAMLGQEYWSAFFAELRRRELKIGIYNEHFQLPKDEFIEEFAQSVDLEHSVLALSVLSGSEKVRRLNGKFSTNDRLLRVLSALRRHRIPIFVYFSLNIPGEDEATLRETIALAEQIQRAYPLRLLRIYNMCHTVDPCSPMSLQPRKYGIQVSMRTFMDYYDYCRQTYVARPELARGALRGFTCNGRKSLAVMARTWDKFCVGRDNVCFPVLTV